MITRSFRLSDHVSVNRLLEDVLSESCYEETKTALARQLSWDSELVLVAEEDGEIVGVIIGTIDNDRGYCYRLAVATSNQGRGIGMTLAKSLEYRFRQRNVNRILVPLDEHNERLQPFFDALGWVGRLFAAGTRGLQIVN